MQQIRRIYNRLYESKLINLFEKKNYLVIFNSHLVGWLLKIEGLN